MGRILITEPDDYSPAAVDAYRRLGPVTLGDTDGPHCHDVSVLVVGLARRVDGRYLDRFSGLKAIATPTTGLNHIDLDICRQRGIRVFSLADCREKIEGITSTSELTIGLMIALLRGISKSHESVVWKGEWDRNRFRSRQLSCLTLGIVGLGRIGGHVATYARAFGMRVVASDPWVAESRFEEMGVESFELRSLLETVDIVSVHANLRPDNHGLIGIDELAHMRPGSLLINTARGALLDEAAAADHLRQRRLGGIAVDVLAAEHNDAGAGVDSPLRSAAQEGCNVIITPHIGGCTRDAMHATELYLAQCVVNTIQTQ